jgi:rod shape-determining protein MreB
MSGTGNEGGLPPEQNDPTEKLDVSKSVAETVAKLKEMEPGRERGILYIGIDLGTSRTRVAASNGVRQGCWSYVGYPKDLVARKALEKDVLFGREAYERKTSVELYRPLEKGVIKFSDGAGEASEQEVERNMLAVKDLVRHAVTLARPRKEELLYGVIGCPAQASIKNKQAIIEAAREVLDSVVICSEPFSVAYGLGVLSDALVIDIGAGTTDLCRMKGSMPDESDQITNDFAGDFVDRALMERLRARYKGAQFTLNQIKEIKEKFATIDDVAHPLMVTFPVDGKPRPFDITEDLREACRSIVAPMVQAVERLVATFDPELQPRIRNNILLGGGGSQIRGLGRAIEEALVEYGGGKVYSVEEPCYAGANGSLAIAQDMPEDTWEQLR